jgi:hypothetical protein
VTSSHAIQRIKLGQSLLAFLIAGIGLGLVVGTTTSAAARVPIGSSAVNSRPNIGETCFTTLNDGATVFSSTDSSAIGQAIGAANPGATIKAAGYCPGPYLSITRSLTLRGGYTNTDWLGSYPVTQPTTLDGLGAGQVLYIAGGTTVTLQGLTISGGHGADQFWCGDGQSGGGIYNDGQLTVLNSLITGNAAGDGFSDPDCGVGNGGNGGGIFNAGILTITNSTLSNNRAGNVNSTSVHFLYGGVGSGGGIFNSGALFVSGSRFIGNSTASGFGGYVPSGAGGGGIASTGSLNIVNALMADNQAVGYGSGIAVDGATLRLTQSTVSTNTGGDGTGLSINGSAILTNSIIVSQDIGLAVTAGHEVQVNGVLWFGNTVNYGGGGVITATHQYTGSPAFLDPSTGDYHLTASSAGINRGVADSVLIDLDGNPRDAAPDLGAYEYQLPWKVYVPLMKRNGL